MLPEVDLRGSAELVERLFFVDDGRKRIAAVPVAVRRAAARPRRTRTNNRYTAQSYRISPVLKGEARDGLALRTARQQHLDGRRTAPRSRPTARTRTRSPATLTQDPRPLGWALDYSRIETRFHAAGAVADASSSACSAVYKPDPQSSCPLTRGYEDNNFSTSDELRRRSTASASSGIRPSARASRRRGSIASSARRITCRSITARRFPCGRCDASRDITTYPQQLATLASGRRRRARCLNQLFTSRVTDPRSGRHSSTSSSASGACRPLLASPLDALFAAGHARRVAAGDAPACSARAIRSS